ncbi:MAG: hypothetical protein PHE92_09300 [Candidatus Cloacimonetes bacterium]|nr:hypothetical protein [Candidatus Cloacimonadota bacterium]
MGPYQTQLLNPTEIISHNNRVETKFASSSPANTHQEMAPRHIDQKVILDSIFPTRQEETRIAKARRILEEIGSDLSDEELEIYLIKFEFLLDTWIDNFEKDIFEGKTLNQLLREG